MARLRLVLMVNYTEFRRMEQHEQIPNHQVQGSRFLRQAEGIVMRSEQHN